MTVANVACDWRANEGEEFMLPLPRFCTSCDEHVEFHITKQFSLGLLVDIQTYCHGWLE